MLFGYGTQYELIVRFFFSSGGFPIQVYTLHVQAASEADRDEWIKAITALIGESQARSAELPISPRRSMPTGTDPSVSLTLCHILFSSIFSELLDCFENRAEHVTICKHVDLLAPMSTSIDRWVSLSLMMSSVVFASSVCCLCLSVF